MNSYETKDIWIASALLTLGYQCKVENTGGSHFIFVFENSDELQEALSRYIRNTLLVDVSSLQTSYKTLKNQIFN